MARRNESVRQERIRAVFSAYDISLTVAERYVADWYRGRRGKGRILANRAIVDAGLLYEQEMS